MTAVNRELPPWKRLVAVTDVVIGYVKKLPENTENIVAVV